jgi:hypothetical protein
LPYIGSATIETRREASGLESAAHFAAAAAERSRVPGA